MRQLCRHDNMFFFGRGLANTMLVRPHVFITASTTTFIFRLREKRTVTSEDNFYFINLQVHTNPNENGMQFLN